METVRATTTSSITNCREQQSRADNDVARFAGEEPALLAGERCEEISIIKVSDDGGTIDRYDHCDDQNESTAQELQDSIRLRNLTQVIV